MLIIRGSGIHEIDFQAYDIRPGAVFLLFPGQVHNWTISPDTEGYIIFHGTEFYNLNFTHEKIEHYPFFCSTQNTPLIRLKPNQLPGIEILFNTIVLEYQQQHLMCFQKVSSLLNVLYIDLSRLYLPAGRRAELGEKQLAQIRCLELLIETHFKVIKSPLK